jgi:NADPH:quinone reductase-like Zn-dependent oxidoreductase
MKAARISGYGHADVIKVVDIERPRPLEGQVLVEVHASSINPFDWKVREGFAKDYLKLSFPVTLGMDLAGVVREVGTGRIAFRVGDNVYGQAAPWGGGSGAFAEFAAAPVGSLARMPGNLTFAEAAALPLTGVSAVQALTEHIRLRSGQKILVHGGSGGIGSMAIQIAKHIGAHVAATASESGIEFVKGLGADEVIDYKTIAFENAISGCDAVYDLVGGEMSLRSFKVLKKGGVIVSMLGQPDPELAKKLGVTSIGQSTQVTAARLDALRTLVEEGVVKVHIDSAFPLERIRDAFAAKEQGKVLGKIAIEIRH